MYPAIKSVVPTEDYMLSIAFDNGETGTLDMKPFLDFGVFRRLKDRSAFKRVRVNFDTIEWDSGIDLDPEFIYEKCQQTLAQQDSGVGLG
jgi:Protein of unknown function (DUF2442)